MFNRSPRPQNFGGNLYRTLAGACIYTCINITHVVPEAVMWGNIVVHGFKAITFVRFAVEAVTTGALLQCIIPEFPILAVTRIACMGDCVVHR